MDELTDEVLKFFQLRVDRKLTIESNLTDFCKDEEDAFFLLMEFFEKYSIFDGYLDIDKYFYKTRTFFWLRFGEKTEGKPHISIKHLIKVARLKRWIDPLKKDV